MDASGFDWYISRETLNQLTDGEVIEAGQRACRDLVAVLARNGFAPGEMLAEAQPHVAAGDITLLLMCLAREGVGLVVAYDDEAIYDAADLAQVLRWNVEATGGEWVAEDIEARLADTGRRHARSGWAEIEAFLGFTTAGERHEWRFEQSSDWVTAEFYELRDAFAAANLPGRFLGVATGDQCHCSVYLSRATVAQIDQVLMALPGAYRSAPASPGYWGFYERFTEAAHRRGGG